MIYNVYTPSLFVCVWSPLLLVPPLPYFSRCIRMRGPLVNRRAVAEVARKPRLTSWIATSLADAISVHFSITFFPHLKCLRNPAFISAKEKLAVYATKSEQARHHRRMSREYMMARSRSVTAWRVLKLKSIATVVNRRRKQLDSVSIFCRDGGRLKLEHPEHQDVTRRWIRTDRCAWKTHRSCRQRLKFVVAGRDVYRRQVRRH